jgi:hypothetical protein
MADQNYSRTQAAPTNYDELNTRDVATDVYTAFRNSGYSDAQAQALTAEINRENSMQQKYLFGSHLDPHNEATNVGMLSWQGDRAPEAMRFLRERGVVGEDGAITPGVDALQAQADFIRFEMENNPSYAKTRELFLDNPDVDPSTAARVLGDNYIGWRRTDPEYAGSGYDRINQGYALLRGDAEGGPTVSANSVLGSNRPKSRPDDLQTSNKSSLDDMSDALAYLDLSGLSGGAQGSADLGARITPGRAGGGARALKRMGIASLV